MKKFVKVTVRHLKLTWPSSNYIYDYRKFNINCEILDEDLGFFKHTYKLCLKGTEDNINSFLSYLRMECFEIISF